MSNFIIYQKSTTLKGQVNLDKLQTEIDSSSISKTVMNKVNMESEFAIVFDQNLNSAEISELNTLVSNHNFLTPEEEVKLIVSNAIVFGQTLILDFAAENVLMGITQAGKTKDVADYLSDVMRYAQSGSLYEVINEVDHLIQEGLPIDLEPFITLNRMNEFKNKIQTYLS